MNENLVTFERKLVEATATLEAVVQPLVKSSTDLHKSLEAAKSLSIPAECRFPLLIEQARAFQNALAPVLTDAAQAIEQLSDIIREEIEILTKSGWSPDPNLLTPIMEALGQAVEQLPNSIKHALKILAENGWYPDPNLSGPQLIEIIEKYSSGNTADANNDLCDYFDSRITEIELDINNRHPTRGRLLTSAFCAHRLGDYALSVPVFLSQADGICKEITGEQLYSRKNGVPKLASILLSSDVSQLSTSFLTPIIEPMPISATSKERVEIDNIFNRHAILHGESTDYDNRLNSCRAISLLVYVDWILREK